MNMLFNVSLTMHVAFLKCCAFKKKEINEIYFVWHFPSSMWWVGGGGGKAHKIIFIFFPPNFVSHPSLPQFCGWEDPMFGGRSNVWIKSHGGMSTNQKHQWMISYGWNLGHKTVSNRIPQSASWEKIRALQWFMLNKRNAVMSFVNFDFWCEVHGAATT